MSAHLKSCDLILEPADNRRLANLCGQFDEHLRQVERSLGVEVNNRGNSFRIIGDARPVRTASRLLQQLYAETAKAALTPAQVHLFLQAAEAETGSRPAAASTLSVQTRRGVVAPRLHRESAGRSRP